MLILSALFVPFGTLLLFIFMAMARIVHLRFI